jgi:hypothetical protein
MPFAVTTPEGNVVRLDDVPLEDLGKIADEAGMESWSDVMFGPLRNWKAALGIYRYCFDLHKETAPEKPTVADIQAAFEWVRDDLPDSFEGGVPKAEDDPMTPGSPGVPSDSDGPLPSPEASPFENSNS